MKNSIHNSSTSSLMNTQGQQMELISLPKVKRDTSLNSDLLTQSEIDSLRQWAQEGWDYLQQTYLKKPTH